MEERIITKNKTCAERIDSHLKSRIVKFKNALDGKYEDESAKYEDFIDWLNHYSLAYSDDFHYRAKKLELSYGETQDYFLFFEDGNIEYHFLDWFDGAKVDLEDDTDEYKVMKEVYDRLTIE